MSKQGALPMRPDVALLHHREGKARRVRIGLKASRMHTDLGKMVFKMGLDSYKDIRGHIQLNPCS